MELSSIIDHLPNWNHFLEKYNPDLEFIEAFFTRLSSIEDSSILENILKRINIELWILILHDVEIDHKLYLSILESIKNK